MSQKGIASLNKKGNNEYTRLTKWSYSKRSDSFFPDNDESFRSSDVACEHELIYPSPISDERQSGIFPAVFNLCATILGGGVLSLPFTFSKLGYALGIFMLLFVAVCSDFSLYILCSCDRRTGSTDFVQVGKAAFGAFGGYLITSIMSLFILFVVVAFQILLRDIASAIVEFQIGRDLAMNDRNMVLMICVLCTLPLCFFNNLYSLRYTCYLGFCSVMLLVGSLVYSAAELNLADPTRFFEHGMAYTTNWKEVLFVFPIVSVTYLCQFNMLAVHAKLKHPTRERMSWTIHWSIIATSFVYGVGSIAGYFCAYENTSDNIFNNFASTNKLLYLGRIALSVTLLCSLPMMVLPCRHYSLALLSELLQFLTQCSTTKQLTQQRDTPQTEKTETFCEQVCKLLVHIVWTLAIVFFALYLAVCIPAVSTVWSLLGSSLGLIISYWLPSACYLRIRRHKPLNKVKIGAWVMLLVSTFLVGLCSYQSVMRNLAPHS